jgi:hypothetical protein
MLSLVAMRARRGRIAVSAASVTILSCAGVDPGELPGTYTATYSVGTEELVLKAGGQYQQTITTPRGAPLVSSGGWWFEESTGKLWLERFIVAHDGRCQLDPRIRDRSDSGTAALTVTKTWRGELQLIANPDYDCNYKKRVHVQ